MTEGCREVNVLDVHSQIAPGTASFATNRAGVTVRASSRIADNVLIQLLVCTCKDTRSYKEFIHIWKLVKEDFLQTRITWLFILVFVSNSSLQYLQAYLKEPGKWRLSTCFLRLPRSFPDLPQIVHLWALGPPSGCLTI